MIAGGACRIVAKQMERLYPYFSVPKKLRKRRKCPQFNSVALRKAELRLTLLLSLLLIRNYDTLVAMKSQLSESDMCRINLPPLQVPTASVPNVQPKTLGEISLTRGGSSPPCRIMGFELDWRREGWYLYRVWNEWAMPFTQKAGKESIRNGQHKS